MDRLHSIVTGAASGLGRELASLLGARGHAVALVDLPDDAGGPGRLAEATRAVEAAGGEAVACPCDVRDAEAWAELRGKLQARWPSLELLVNNAGIGASAEVGTLAADRWRRVIDTNLLGTAYGCETFLPWLRECPRRSHLVNVASIAGILAPPMMAAYSASKAGVIAISEAIAAESPPGRPGVTVVCPGFFRSGLLETWSFASGVDSVEAHRRMRGSRWSSERMAVRVLRAIDRGERYVVEGIAARFLWRLKRLAPRATTTLVRAAYTRLGRPSRRVPASVEEG